MTRSEAWTYVDGKRVTVPLDYNEANAYGWYKGIKLCEWFFIDDDIVKMKERDTCVVEWCKETFERNTYKVFYNSIWFYRESDAMLCRLKWA